jgi:hypothetical protein
MNDRPSGFPEDFPYERMSRERFEHILLGIRNGVSMTFTTLAVNEATERESSEGLMADQRAVWHAAEIALAVLRPGYVPRREAVADVRNLLAWLDDEDDSWTGTD